MRRFLRYLFLRPVLWASQKFSSRPQRDRIFRALDELSLEILSHPGKKGIVMPFDPHDGKFIIFSDQHKGARNGADDFMAAEPNYLTALEYYNGRDFIFINLGDSEELWENTLGRVKKHNEENFQVERKFVARDAFVKVIGNHDLYWGNDPFAWWQLKKIFGADIKAYEGVILETVIKGNQFRIFCTHGHQGDAQSDGNWFSKFFVARVWAPFQAYLRINPNTTAYDDTKKTLHNEIMYEWSSIQQRSLLVTGHTHQPVFESLTHIERLYRQYQQAESSGNKQVLADLYAEIKRREKEFTAVSADYLNMKPSYFNTGCCCFVDGDITGIEIEGGFIRLVKWTAKDGNSHRMLLEEMRLEELSEMLK